MMGQIPMALVNLKVISNIVRVGQIQEKGDQVFFRIGG